MKYFSYFFAIVCVLSLSYLASCSDKDSTSTLFNLRMTDGPIDDATEVNIDLETVIVITNEGRDSFELTTNAGVYNLLDFQNGLDTLIGSSIVDADTIHQIRLVLGENNSIVFDSISHELKTPSAQQSGLKINVQKDVSELEVFNLLIDFDARESVVELGNGNGGYLLKPVIKIVE